MIESQERPAPNSRSIFMERQSILAAARRHGAGQVRVFGSVARGEATATSDVDLLVEFEASRSLMDHAALVEELEGILGRRVDVVSVKALKPELRQEILRDAVPL